MSQPPSHAIVEKQGQALVRRFRHEILRVEPWGADSVRVRATRLAEVTELPGALLPPPETRAEIHIGGDLAVLRNGKLRVEIDPAGRLRFLHADRGTVLLQEPETEILKPGGREYRAVGGDLFHLEARFQAFPDEAFHGLGQHRHGRLNQKGCVVDLAHRNCEIAIPFTLSSRGYGFLWHNPGIGRAELGLSETRWVAEGTRQLDYWVTAGDSPAEILAHYAEATGHPPMLPEWASGFWQCKLRYKNQDEVLRVAREHKARGLPMSVIVIDFFHWPMMGDLCFDKADWPDPAAMVRELAEMGIRVMISIWPSFNPNSEHCREFRDRGFLLRTDRGSDALFPFMDTRPEGEVCFHFYDPSHPEARARFWDIVRRNYLDLGIKIFWLDACEPEMVPVDHANLRFHIGSGQEVASLYPFLHEQAFYEGMKAAGEEEVVLLCRSGWAGSQRFKSVIWSGDIASTFEALQTQVRAGLNMAMSGIPWWTTDIGGFHNGDIRTEEFRELIVRWFQYGVFCPMPMNWVSSDGFPPSGARTRGWMGTPWAFSIAFRPMKKFPVAARALISRMERDCSSRAAGRSPRRKASMSFRYKGAAML
jgi:alpha-D-xyloside xylohydrolase